MLSEIQLAQYQDDGYTVVRNVLDENTLAELRRVTDEIVSTAKNTSEHTAVLDLEPSHTPKQPRVRRIKTPQHVHPFYRSLAAHPNVLAALTPLIGENIRLGRGCKVNLKSAGYGSPVEWHQDWAFYPHTNQDVLAVGILLDDMDSENSPVMFVPGSHTGPVYSHHTNGAFCGAIDTTEEHVDLSKAVEIHGYAGDITIHHARLIHGSSGNHSSRGRRVLFYEYSAADAWPLGGVEHVQNLEEFNARLVQGEPTLQPRLENVPVRMPLPIAPFQGSIYENQRTLKNPYFYEQSEAAS